MTLPCFHLTCHTEVVVFTSLRTWWDSCTHWEASCGQTEGWCSQTENWLFGCETRGHGEISCLAEDGESAINKMWSSLIQFQTTLDDSGVSLHTHKTFELFSTTTLCQSNLSFLFQLKDRYLIPSPHSPSVLFDPCLHHIQVWRLQVSKPALQKCH